MELINLPEINFIDTNIEKLLSEKISRFENAYLEQTGKEKKLFPGDPIRIMLYSESLREYQLLILINEIAKHNLLKYATGEVLKHKGAFFNVEKIKAKKAKVNIKLILSKIFNEKYVIPKKTRFTPGNEIYFEIIEDVEINAGSTEITFETICTKSGSLGNNYTPGQINTLADPIAFIESISNIDVSSGGSEEEDDESFKERIRLAPESYSSAGAEDAYIYIAKKFSTDIKDVKVISTTPGRVEIIIAMKYGLPSNEFLIDFQDYMSDKRRRPLTDFVQVSSPESRTFNIDFTYYISESNKLVEEKIKSKVTAAVDTYINWQNEKIGRHINPSKLSNLVMEAGASRIVINSPSYMNIEENELLEILNTTITFGGIESE